MKFGWPTSGPSNWAGTRVLRTTNIWRASPNLVIEVLSPSNTVDEINDKMDVCMSNGCTSFWIVDPKRQQVAVTEGDVTRQYRDSASIPLPPPLDGSITVSSIFASVRGSI